MILEVAILEVKKGMEDTFETDFKKASAYIALTPGYLNHKLNICIEQPNKYILLVEWETLEDHTIGFRTSDNYNSWKALLHPYYDPFPTVEHYETRFEMKKDH
ncbi:antibiotic biosynthesis monooxygenase family protein [Formosa haliotis]|uniref:antibiotic biosynthesis monooxygenase family protein n=1 Tax=Formosa haliotis TaxID=1555194 RepID=UPI000824E229|nr:antibiotic biosynthesis monooxygenase [Formosa haliotis]